MLSPRLNAVSAVSDANPLLDFSTPTPHWERIQAAHLEPAIDQILAENRALVDQLLAAGDFSWEALVAPLEEAENRLHRAFGAGSHLHGVQNTTAWRQAYEACLPKLTEYSSEIGQNAELCAAYREVATQSGLSAAQGKLLADVLRDFRLSGVELAATDKARYSDIQQRLATLANQFERNLLDATDAYQCHIEDATQLRGLPESALARAAERARDKQLSGWLFGLDFPSFDAIVTYAEDRELRQRLYRAYTTRASELGEDPARDNAPLMAEILQLKSEQAQLLGFASYAELSLASKMAESPQQVEDFLLELATRAKPAAERELASLSDFARALGGPEQLASWDFAHYAEKLKQSQFGLDEEALRPYFPLPQVLRGLFGAAEKLFAIQLNAAPLPCWHDDVLAFEVRDESQAPRAWFYLDPYAREKKRGGAWMDDPIGRMRQPQGLQLPVATLTCNFPPPLDGQPALLSHDDVVTLFHEFGHGLQHMLTTVEYLGVSGINGVPWDAVELASQFMENWCWEPQALAEFARHHATGEAIPAEWIEQIRASRVFQSGLATLRQVELALFDLRLHGGDPSRPVSQVLQQVRDEVAVLHPPEWNRFANGFSHIFGGGYAAGYYSYKWAEVLAADAFSAFAETDVFDRATGQRFKECVLEPGGSEDAMTLFQRFRGRPPQVDALLLQEGLA